DGGLHRLRNPYCAIGGGEAPHRLRLRAAQAGDRVPPLRPRARQRRRQRPAHLLDRRPAPQRPRSLGRRPVGPPRPPDGTLLMRAGVQRFGLAAILLVALAGALVAAPTFPALTGRVVDEAGILPADAKAALDAKLSALEAKTTDQFVVVTLKSLQ